MIVPNPTVQIVVGSNEAALSWDGPASQSLIDHRIRLERMIGAEKSDAPHLKERLSRLVGQSVSISVGGATAVEAKERRDRLAAGLRAGEAAVRGGVVAGGGAALVRVAGALAKEEFLTATERHALDAFCAALNAPFDAICRNAGVYGPLARDALAKESGDGAFNLDTRKVVDAFESGLIEAQPVVSTALKNAVGTVVGLLNSSVILTGSDV